MEFTEKEKYIICDWLWQEDTTRNKIKIENNKLVLCWYITGGWFKTVPELLLSEIDKIYFYNVCHESDYYGTYMNDREGNLFNKLCSLNNVTYDENRTYLDTIQK